MAKKTKEKPQEEEVQPYLNNVRNINEDIKKADLEPLNPEATTFKDKKTNKIFVLDFEKFSGKFYLRNLQK